MNPQSKKYSGQATRSIHSSSLKDAYGSPHLPVYNTTTFTAQTTADQLDVVDKKKPGFFYTRFGQNPNIVDLEETMAAIEDTEASMAFCSGMAAISALFTTYGREGIVSIGGAYGGTMTLLTNQMPLLGINTTFVLAGELDKAEQALRAGAKLVYFETPTNPAMEIQDIAAIAQLAHKYDALVAIDNTFASPIVQQPLKHGADLVIYSATKYLGGHSDITAGLILGKQDLLTPIWPWRMNLGSAISPEVAALLSRSLRTLKLRVDAQSAAALDLALALQADPRIKTVLYPGLPQHPDHELAARQMNGFGGMLTIALNADEATTTRVADRLELFALAPSLGGVESLATQPVTSTHRGVSAAERERFGITGSMIRLSVGLEDVTDLLTDLRQALDVIDQG